MMDSAAKTLSPTAESSMVHHAPRLFLSLLLFLASPFLFGLFNFAHPIIRNLERTSWRLFLLPGTAVGRTDRGWAHRLSCCYVLRVSERMGRSPAALAALQECLAQRNKQSHRLPERLHRHPEVPAKGNDRSITHISLKILEMKTDREECFTHKQRSSTQHMIIYTIQLE